MSRRPPPSPVGCTSACAGAPPRQAPRLGWGSPSRFSSSTWSDRDRDRDRKALSRGRERVNRRLISVVLDGLPVFLSRGADGLSRFHQILWEHNRVKLHRAVKSDEKRLRDCRNV